MAIVVESSNNKNWGNLLVFIIWFILLAAVVAGAYYVFFKKPEIISVSAPPELEEAKNISQIRLNPQDVLGNPKFKSLRSYITPSEAKTFGKNNPFLGP